MKRRAGPPPARPSGGTTMLTATSPVGLQPTATVPASRSRCDEVLRDIEDRLAALVATGHDSHIDLRECELPAAEYRRRHLVRAAARDGLCGRLVGGPVRSAGGLGGRRDRGGVRDRGHRDRSPDRDSRSYRQGRRACASAAARPAAPLRPRGVGSRLANQHTGVRHER